MDISSVSRFASNISKSLSSAPADLQFISPDVSRLHTVLKETNELVNPADNPVELQRLVRSCHTVLTDIETVLSKFQTWGTLWAPDHAAALKKSVLENTAQLTAFNDNAKVASAARFTQNLAKSRSSSGALPRDRVSSFFSAYRKFLERNKRAVQPRKPTRPAKLMRITEVRFGELLVDVYDEVQRKMHVASTVMPHLPADPGMHPVRSIARQKLSTLPESRMCDLVMDVFEEMRHRYPDADKGEGEEEVEWSFP
ncbi:hypothetical protein K440DRAFT_657971 [Wilcoxina mikolae CBS 423.85]|nr:hypothetical protein K440DRAFT_657971 [Wilcoxina mikolae CBS 423.85]